MYDANSNVKYLFHIINVASLAALQPGLISRLIDALAGLAPVSLVARLVGHAGAPAA